MIIEANARPIVMEIPIPNSDNANLVSVDELAFRQFSLLVGADDPRLEISGFNAELDMILLTSENLIAIANQTPANLGDAVNEWANYENNSLILDTRAELDACASDIKNYNLNDHALNPNNDEIIGRLVIPIGVCYDGIPELGADPQTRVVQATAQAVYQILQEDITENDEKKGFVKGVATVVGLIGATLLITGIHRAFKRSQMGYGILDKSTPNSTDEPNTNTVQILQSYRDRSEWAEKYATELGPQNVRFTSTGGIEVRYPVPERKISADGAIEWIEEPVWLEIAVLSKNLQGPSIQPSIPHPLAGIPILRSKEQMKTWLEKYQKEHPEDIVSRNADQITILDPVTRETELIARVKIRKLRTNNPTPPPKP